jgi:hypothetical protein
MRVSIPAVVLGLASGSCLVEEDVAMFIEGVLPSIEPACAPKPTDIVFISNGVLDLKSGFGYSTHLKVRTNLPATFNNADVGQDQTRSPNYPDYGAVDNNVVTFESADVTLRFRSDPNTIAALANQIADGSNDPNSPLAGVNLKCEGDACFATTPMTVPAAGTVFNIQTQLNTPGTVVLELLPADVAGKLSALFEAAREGDKAGVDVRNYLDTPFETQRLNLEIVLNGRTTGNQNFRKVTSAPYPFDIVICEGCLVPDQQLCGTFNALVDELADAKACRPGQDDPLRICVCGDSDGDGFPGPAPVKDGTSVPLNGDGDVPLVPVIDDRNVCGEAD